MVFPVVMYGSESWTIKKADRWRIDAFELWHWRRHLRILWTARRSNQSILKKINPEYSLERLTLKLQYFGHVIWRTDSLEKTLMLGNIEGRRRRGQQRMVGWHHRLNRCESEQTLGDSEGPRRLVCCSSWGHEESEKTWRLYNRNILQLKSLYLFAYIVTKAIFFQSILYILWTVACQAPLSIEFSR